MLGDLKIFVQTLEKLHVLKISRSPAMNFMILAFLAYNRDLVFC